MKLIMHIGMGKTGTSSIQYALRTNPAELEAQRARYLGMWFDAIDPKYATHRGFREFCRQTDSELVASAQAYARHLDSLAEDKGIDTCIFSNEALFVSGPALAPFLTELANHVDLSILAYVRNPYQWLPSAFTQWGLFHKQQAGPLQSFRDRCRILIGHYAALPFWIDSFGDSLSVRRHDKSLDVVADFATLAGLHLTLPDKRMLERSEPAEILLRAAFNNRFPQEVFPERFNNVLSSRKPVNRLEDIAALCFQHEGIDEVIEGQRPLFETIHARLGDEFDFLSHPSEPHEGPDMQALQSRLIDYLVEISLQQAERIATLEKQIKPLIQDQ
jgi:hypothetical protein